MKNTKSKKQHSITDNAVSHNPVNLVVPNTTQEKMAAMVNLSQAILELSKALGSVHLQATISNNIINGAQTGIRIQS